MSFVKSRPFSVVYMFVISAIFAGLLSGVKVVTNPMVKANIEFAENSSMVRVFDLLAIDSDTTNEDLKNAIEKYVQPVWVIDKDGSPSVTETKPSDPAATAFRAWASLDEQGHVQAYAFPIGGKGFWGPIAGLLAVEPDGKTIRNVVWTKHSETPGLGARIEEDGYRAKFAGKLATKEFKVVPDGSMGDDPHKLDAITGASETTKNGLGKFLPENFANWQTYYPAIMSHFAGKQG